MQFVIAYDIHNARRRARVLDLLRNHGFPVQRSVVECELDAGRAQTVRGQLAGIIQPRQDQVRFYALCEKCYLRTDVIGRDPVPIAGSLSDSSRRRKRRPGLGQPEETVRAEAPLSTQILEDE